MRWLKPSSAGFALLCAYACGPNELQICDPGTSWSHDLAACVADDGTGMRDDPVTTRDSGAPDAAGIDVSPMPDAGVQEDAEVRHDAEILQDAAVVDAAPPVEPEDAGGGDAEIDEPDAAKDAGFDECIDGTVEMVPCGRRALRRRCVDGQWHEPSCMTRRDGGVGESN
jgi:hypothetical protein